MTVGFVGLGAMGQPMTSHLLRAGIPVLAFDIDAGAVDRFAANGGTPARDVAEIAERASLVITSLPSFAAVQDVVGVLTDTVLIEASTLALGQKLAVRAMADAAGVTVYDCPISGTGAQAVAGDIVAYLSGPEAPALTEVRRVLAAMCRATYWMGEFGNGTRMKLVANLLVTVHNVATAEALLLARRAGLDLDLVLESVGDGAGASRMLAVRGPLMASGAVEQATARVDLFQKDIAAIRSLAAELGCPTPLLDASSPVYDLAAERGMAGHDAAAVFIVLADVTPAART
jgi:putative dehydrogenase